MTVTIAQLIARAKSEYNYRAAKYNDNLADLKALRSAATPDVAKIDALRDETAKLRAEIETYRGQVVDLERAQSEDDEVARRQAESHPTGVGLSGYDGSTRDVGGAFTAQRQAPGGWVRSDGVAAGLERNERFADHPAARFESQGRSSADQAVIGQHGSIGQLVRALTTGGGSAIVPTAWAGDLIDRARAKSAILQAGSTLVPMDAKTVQIGRLTGDPTASFRPEGNGVTATDPTFDNVTLTAKTMQARVVGTLEWFQDADNAEQVVADSIAQAMASQLDLVALYGSIEDYAGGAIDLPAADGNPRGVLAALNALLSSHVLGGSTNGTAQTSSTFYNELIDLLFTVRNSNEEPSGLVWATKAAQLYAKAYDTTGQPLQMPVAVADVPRFTSNRIPSYTQGTMTNVATDVFAGDWSQLLIGQRLDLTLQVLTEAYADEGKIGVLATWRGDVQVARPSAFAVYRALKGA